ncbi:MAG: SCO family protein [Planctomycetaceae bacterium]
MTARFGHRRATLVAAAMLLATATPLCAEYRKSMPKQLENVGIDEHLETQIPLDTAFRNEGGRIVRLRDYFKGERPVILSLNYSSCPMLCNQQLTGLTNGLKNVEWTAGKEFEVVSISIDPREPPHRAEETQKKYVQLYGRGHGGWNFLVGSHKSIDAVTSAVGFRYQYLPDVNEYAHPAAAVLCTPDGRISRYLYGVEFPEQMLRLSLVEASEGEIGTPTDQFLLFCFHYDPLTGTYAPRAARLMMSVGGLLTVVLIGGGLFVLWSKDSLRASRDANPVSAGAETSLHKTPTG